MKDRTFLDPRSQAGSAGAGEFEGSPVRGSEQRLQDFASPLRSVLTPLASPEERDPVPAALAVLEKQASTRGSRSGILRGVGILGGVGILLLLIIRGRRRLAGIVMAARGNHDREDQRDRQTGNPAHLHLLSSIRPVSYTRRSRF